MILGGSGGAGEDRSVRARESLAGSSALYRGWLVIAVTALRCHRAFSHHLKTGAMGGSIRYLVRGIEAGVWLVHREYAVDRSRRVHARGDE